MTRKRRKQIRDALTRAIEFKVFDECDSLADTMRAVIEQLGLDADEQAYMGALLIRVNVKEDKNV